jgi:hypothetical protein
VGYPFNLQTHCGIEWAYFDGRYWVPKGKAVPSPDWASIERGVMTMADNDAAVFAGRGADVRFEPAPDDYEPPPCA